MDSVSSHKDFCAKENLTFKLLSDSTAKVSESYGSTRIFKEKTYASRHTFIVSPDGKIAKVYPKVDDNIKGHSEEVLAALAELQAAYKPPLPPPTAKKKKRKK